MALNIDELLDSKGLNKAKLSEMLGRGDNRSYVTNLLKNPTLTTLQKIADTLEIDIKDLFYSTNKTNDVIHIIVNEEHKVFNNIEDLKKYVNEL